VSEWWEENDAFKLGGFAKTPELRELLRKCLAREPSARPTIVQVIADIHRDCAKLVPDVHVDAPQVRRYLADFRAGEGAAQKLAKLAAARDPNALFLLAVERRAPAQLKAAADAGSVQAAFRYAVAAQFGRGVPRNQREAAAYYDRVIQAEPATPLANCARNNLAGLIELRAIDGEDRLLRLYRKAADGGLREAIANTARCLQQGIGGPANPAEAARFAARLEAAAPRRAKAEDPLDASRAAIAAGKLAVAVAALDKVGSPDAKFALAAILGSEALLGEAAAAGVPAAQVNRGIALAAGGGRADEAAGLFKQAADAGNGYGRYNLGVAIEKGIAKGTPEQAAALFRAAAEAGVPEGMLAYADSLETGTGVEADAALAADWYQRAVEASKRTLTDADIAVVRLKDKP
jgi:TPR repeat protein